MYISTHVQSIGLMFLGQRQEAIGRGSDLPLSKKLMTQEEARAAHRRHVDGTDVGR